MTTREDAYPYPGEQYILSVDRYQIEVMDHLDELPATEAEILRLTVWEQLTPSEVAVVLAITPGAARTLLCRARKKLKSRLEGQI